LKDSVNEFVINATFSTLTNVNFDLKRFVQMLKQAQHIKKSLKAELGAVVGETAEALYKLPDTMETMLSDAAKAGIMYDKSLNEDIRSLKETLIYGLKGMGAGILKCRSHKLLLQGTGRGDRRFQDGR
jgi:hydroxylamine reductase